MKRSTRSILSAAVLLAILFLLTGTVMAEDAIAGPTLVGPFDGAHYVWKEQVPFDWEDVPDATGYVLQYARNENFTSADEEETVNSSFTVTFGISEDELIYWRVKAVGDAWESEWSEVWSFTTSYIPAPVKLTPENNSTMTETVITYTWEAVDFVEYYNLLVEEVSPETEVHNQSYDADVYCNETTCSVTVADELTPDEYQWGVTPHEGDHSFSGWGGRNVFTVEDDSAVTLISPEDGSTTYSHRPVFDWEDVPDAAGYTIQYAQDAGFSSPQEASVAVSTFTPAADLALGEWFWRVKETGGEWSTVWQLSIIEPSSDDFVITIDTNPLVLPWFSNYTLSTQFMIQTYPDETYNYNVDCDNDGTNEAENVHHNYTCNYAAEGVYTVRIKDNTGNGTGFPRMYVNGQYDMYKLVSVDQWGTGKWSSMAYAFAGAGEMSVNATDAPDLTNVTSLSAMFMNCLSIKADFSGWDTSSVTDMSLMFYMVQDIDINLGNWDVTSLVDADEMFYDAEISISNYDALLVGWGAQNLQSNVTFDAGSSKYCHGEAARSTMTETKGWTITDGGKNCDFGAPELASPANGATVWTTTPTFDWMEVSLASGYTLQYSRDAGFTDPTEVSVSRPPYTVPSDMAKGLWYWRVNATDDYSNTSAWTEVRSFTVDELGIPTPRFPKNDYLITTGTTLLKWTMIDEADAYDVQLIRPDGSLFDFFVLGTDVCADGLCQLKLPYKLDVEYGSWSWRVRVLNTPYFQPTIYGDWSDAAYFSYVQLDKMSPQGPADAAVVTTSTPTFTWAASTQGVYRYVLEIWALDGTLAVVDDFPTGLVCSGEVCSWTVDSALADGVYTWHVLGKKWPNNSGWSASEVFTVDTAGGASGWTGLAAGNAFSAPTAKYPRNDWEITTGTTLIKWGPVAGASSYVLELVDPDGNCYDAWEIASSVCDATSCQYKLPYKLGTEFGVWQWRVRGKDGDSVGAWSSYGSFNYMQLDLITLTAPVDDVNTRTATPTFTWEDSSQNVFRYVIEIWSYDNTLVLTQSLDPGSICADGVCSWTSTSLSPDYYKWRVLGKKWPNNSGWSEMGNFVSFP